MIHPMLTLDQIGRCGAARIPVPPREAVRHACPTGDDLFDIEELARWRFSTPAKQAAGEKPVYLICYKKRQDGGSMPANGDEEAAVIAKIKAML